MAEEELDGAHIGAALDQVHGEGVPQGMGGDRLGEAAPALRLLARLLDGVRGDGPADSPAREEPGPGPGHAPPGPQELQEPWGEHDVAILLPLALLDAEDHALTVDVGRLQPDGLGDAEPRGVAHGQNRAVLQARHGLEELPDLCPACTMGRVWGFLGAGIMSATVHARCRVIL